MKRIDMGLLVAALVSAGVMSCAGTPLLLETSPKIRPDWTLKLGQEDGGEIFYHVEEFKPKSAEITKKGGYTLQEAQSEASKHAYTQIGSYVGSSINSEFEDLQTDKDSKTSLQSLISSSAFLEGVMQDKTYYERYLMIHKGQQIEYYYFWGRYKVSKSAVETARQENRDARSREEQEKRRFNDWYHAFTQRIGDLDSLDPDGELYAQKYVEMTYLKNKMEGLSYYEEKKTEIDELVNNYDPTNRLKNRIKILDEQLKKAQMDYERTNAAKQAIETSMNEYTNRILEAIRDQFKNMTVQTSAQGTDTGNASRQSSESGAPSQNDPPQGSAGGIGTGSLSEPGALNKPDRYAIGSKGRRITVGKKSIFAMPITNAEYYVFSPDKMDVMSSGETDWLDQPVEVYSPGAAFDYCNALSVNAGYVPVYQRSGENYRMSGDKGYRLPTYNELQRAAADNLLDPGVLTEYKWITHDFTVDRDIRIVYYKTPRIGSSLVETREAGKTSFMVVLDEKRHP